MQADNRPLVASAFFGLVALAAAGAGLAGALRPHGPEAWADWLYRSAGVILLQGVPEATRAGHWDLALAIAQVAAVCFVATGAYGAAITLSAPVRQWHGRTLVHLSRRPLTVLVGSDPVHEVILKTLTPSGPVSVVDGCPSTSATLVVSGDPTSEQVRRRGLVERAREIFISTGADLSNLAVGRALLLDAPPARSPHALVTCHVRTHTDTFRDPPAAIAHLHDPSKRIAFHVYNLEEELARAVLLRSDGALRPRNAGMVPYFFVLGFDGLGQAMALQVARLAHFESRVRARMTIVDPTAANTMSFLHRFPAFCPDPTTFTMTQHRRLNRPDKDLWSCRQWRPGDPAWMSTDEHAVEYAINAEFLVPPHASNPSHGLGTALRERLEPCADDPVDVEPVFVVCSGDSGWNVDTAVWLRDWLVHDSGWSGPVPVIWTYVDGRLPGDGFGSASSDSSLNPEIRVFGPLTAPTGYEVIAKPRWLRLGRQIHDRYLALTGPGPAFEDLAPIFRASNVDVAAHAEIKLDIAGLTRRRAGPGDVQSPVVLPDDIRLILAEVEHNRWMAERLVSGWRYGDRAARRRPSFVPWEVLRHRHPAEALKDVSQVDSLISVFSDDGDLVERIDDSK